MLYQESRRNLFASDKMLSTLHMSERVLPVPDDNPFSIHDHPYVKFLIPLGAPFMQTKKRNILLPFDIKDIVLNLLDSPRDLVSLALTSREWAITIIPDYLYRELDVRLTHGEIWKALASRPILAQRTHTLRLLEPAPHGSDQFTSTKNNTDSKTGPKPKRIPADLSSVVHDLSLALPNFASLRKFSWTGSRRPLEITQNLLKALGRCPMLEDIDLGPVVLDEGDRHDVTSKASLWKLDRLTKLTLRGDWDRSGADVLYLSLINNSSNLEELSILYGPASIHFTSCALPKLRKLHLWHDSLYIQFPESELYPYDVQIFTFLLNHPLIEDLRWLTWSWTLSASSSPLLTHSKFLPNLKHLRAYGQLYRTLLVQDKGIRNNDDNSLSATPTDQKERKWESISRATLSTDIPILEKLDLTMLREVRLVNFESFDSLARLAGLAKGITTLAIPGFGPPPAIAYQYHGQQVQSEQAQQQVLTMESFNLEQYFISLSQFPRLGSLLDTRLWASITCLDPVERAKALTSLTAKCPKLHRLNHWDPVRHVEVDIIFERDVDAIRWYETPSSEENWERFGGV